MNTCNFDVYWIFEYFTKNSKKELKNYYEEIIGEDQLRKADFIDTLKNQDVEMKKLEVKSNMNQIKYTKVNCII